MNPSLAGVIAGVLIIIVTTKVIPYAEKKLKEDKT